MIISEARRRYAEALTARPCAPMDICVAARALRNAQARAGWTASQSFDDFRDFGQLEVEAARAPEGDSPPSLIVGAILNGLGLHVAFVSYPPHIEPLVPFRIERSDRDKLWEDLVSPLDSTSIKLHPKLVELAHLFAAAEWARDVYPWQSMFALGVSRSESFNKSRELPAIWFQFDPKRSEYLIRYQPKWGQGPETEEWVSSITQEVRHRILNWLDFGTLQSPVV